jgi:23S rRNA pseudouridine1911/1915/1917 synthase
VTSLPPDVVSDESEDTDRPDHYAIPVDDASSGGRLDAWVARKVDSLSRNRAQTLIVAGAIRVDGTPASPSLRLRTGQVVTVSLFAPDDPSVHLDGSGTPVAEDIPLDVIYEDTDIVVIDKPAGLVVHPAPGHPRGTLVNALMHRYPEMRVGGEVRPGIVHRLDRDTSGLIIVARHDRALAAMQTQFHNRTVEKRYITLVDGTPRTDAGVIEAPIGRRPDRPDLMGIVSPVRGGKSAVTRFRTITRYAGHTVLECVLVTGRTHQIRVHLASIGVPVVADRVYGRASPTIPLGRQFLHAATLEFTRPNGVAIRLESPLPSDLEGALQVCGPASVP